MAERRPNRALGGVNDEFWSFCQAHELRLQQCGGCQAFLWPPADKCEQCGGLDLEWQPVAGTGELVTWATFEHRYFDELELPYETILVELSEGPLFISNPLDFTRLDMGPGQRVKVDFLNCEDDHGEFALPVFRKAE
jgi:uncharacterized OB-fold protein